MNADFFKGLNHEQKNAVLHDHQKGGALLILAGAGSGKTSVLTKRIQYRIRSGVPDSEILALTFTAAAAQEMKERVEELFPNTQVRLSTFHSLALALLRRQYNGVYGFEYLGFKKPPLPKEDSGNSFSNALAAHGVSPRALLRENLFSPEIPPKIERKLQPLRAKILESGHVVFEDLIFCAIRLLENHPAVREIIQSEWTEILVDEYQDINPSQYRLVRLILGERQSLFVVGDDDQAIYGFRGADIGNIRRFQKDFPHCTTILLEWNYRSAPRILALANRIFENKPVDLRKVLRSGSLRCDALFAENRKPECWVSENPLQELQRLVSKMKELRLDYELSWKSFAILVRYNHQRLYFEHAFTEMGIPVGSEEVEDGVQVETIHGSKGLQYPVVFYAGLMEGLSPGTCEGSRKVRKKTLEEERRLFYVGVTRAETALFFLYCRQRFWKGTVKQWKPSRFLSCLERPPENYFRMLFLFRLSAVLQVLFYMLWAIVRVTARRIFCPKTVAPWIDATVQNFSRFCMRCLRIDISIEGQANLSLVDWKRPVIVVANHQSYADIPVVFLALSRTVGFLAKRELGYVPCLGFWMRRIGCLFVNRKKKGEGIAVQKTLREGGIVPRISIFPEGTRSKDGQLQSFKSGAFRLAEEFEATLIPLAIENTRAAWESRKDTALVPVKVSVLKPLSVKELKESGKPYGAKTVLLPEICNRIASRLKGSASK